MSQILLPCNDIASQLNIYRQQLQTCTNQCLMLVVQRQTMSSRSVLTQLGRYDDVGSAAPTISPSCLMGASWQLRSTPTTPGAAIMQIPQAVWHRRALLPLYHTIALCHCFVPLLYAIVSNWTLEEG